MVSLLLLCALIGGGPRPDRVTSIGKKATLRVNAVGLFGTPYALRFKLRRVHPAPATEVWIQGNVATAVDYGTYVLQASDRAFVINKTVEVHEPTVFVTVGLPLPDLDGDVHGLDGDCVPLRDPGELVWARLISVFSDLLIETQVRSDGTFSLRGMPGGLYILAIISGDRVLFLKQVPVRSGIGHVCIAER